MTMQPIPVEEAQSQLAEILAKLVPGEEVVLTRDGKPAATIRSITPFSPQAPDASRGIPGRLAVQTMPVTQAESHLIEMVGKLLPEEEIVLTGNGKLIATLRSPQVTRREPPRLGTLKGTVLYMAPDFDDIPEGFEEYLP
jgi:antitoxin (DNA-binding transcriptional repressor) of toxin-antitoxin stability system